MPWLLPLSTAQKGVFLNYNGIELKDLENNQYPLSGLSANKVNVFVFLLPDCPACQSYSLTLNNLETRFSKAGIRFYGVFPGNYNSVSEMIDYKKQYRILFPLLRDPDKKLVSALNAKVAPEAFVCDDAGKILYHGRIDDWMIATGKKKPMITENNLADILAAIEKHRPVYSSSAAAIGCIIE